MRHVIVLLLAVSCAGYAASDRYDVDPEHFTVGFLVEHVGFAKVFGMFRVAEASFSFNEESALVSDVRVVIKADSIFTGIDARDRHLRSEDFLSVKVYPNIVFESDRTILKKRKGYLTGTLTILGVSKPLTLTVTWNKSGLSPLSGSPYVAGFSLRGSFERSDFGMNYGIGDGLVGDTVELIIELEAHRQ